MIVHVTLRHKSHDVVYPNDLNDLNDPIAFTNPTTPISPNNTTSKRQQKTIFCVK